MAAMFNAASKSFSTDNEVVKAELKKTNKLDTTALRLLTEDVLSRFIDEQLIDLECRSDYLAFKPAFDYYDDAQCKCLTAKMDAVNKGGSRMAEYAPYHKECTERLWRDSAFVANLRSMILVPEKFQEYSSCISLFSYKNCAFLRNDLVRMCIYFAIRAFKNEREAANNQIV